MIDLNCAHCRRRSLVGTRSIEALHHEEGTIVLHVRCPCGKLSRITTGRGARTNAAGELHEWPGATDPTEARMRAA